MDHTIDKALEKLRSGFYAFWVMRYRVTYLMMFSIIVIGLVSAISIPKESSPDIKFGIISVSTINTGVSPQEIDTLITEKLEREINDIDGIDTYTSQSRNGMSSITITLDTDADKRVLLADIEDAVDSVRLPSEAEDPVVREISSEAARVFDLLVYGDQTAFSVDTLKEKATTIQSELESISGISSVDIIGGNNYEVSVRIQKDTLDALGLSLDTVASRVNAFNKNQSIGSYTLGDLNYDYRFSSEFLSFDDIAAIPIIQKEGNIIHLGDIATIQKSYEGDTVYRLGGYDFSGQNYIRLVVNKQSGQNVFSIANDVKTSVSEIFERYEFQWLSHQYAMDMSELIQKDYSELAQNALMTFAFVFLIVFLFIGLRQATIALFSLPLAFLVTFFVLNQMGLSMNFLTNFSLVISLGIAIDTTVVIIEGSYAKFKLGYDPQTAVLLAVREFSAPLISGTATTLAAFLPLLSLPGVMGKFLAYIPITIFSTLLAALFISLTINPTLFSRLQKRGGTYVSDPIEEKYLSDEDRNILDQQRIGKEKKDENHTDVREKYLGMIGNLYENFLEAFIASRTRRLLSVFVPVVLLILSFIFISPKIGFTLFPAQDAEFMTLTVQNRNGSDESVLSREIDHIESVIEQVPEMELYYLSVGGSKITGSLELVDPDLRERTSSQISQYITKELNYLRKKGYMLSVEEIKSGPPGSKPIAIELISSSSLYFDQLLTVAQDFENFVIETTGTKNVTMSAKPTPGEFNFTFDQDTLYSFGLTPSDVYRQVYAATSWVKAGTIRGDIDDYDIVLEYSDYQDTITPDQVLDLIITTPSWVNVRLGEIASYDFVPAVNQILRNEWNISIKVGSDVKDVTLTGEIFDKILLYADNYDFPEGISYLKAGENAENSDLIVSTVTSFFVAIILIFTILVLQFNSYSQPAIILYSVILAMLGVNIGLFLTGNPYSMPFAIGFISLMGIVVNDAIILIDTINKNLKRGMDGIMAVGEAGKSRLEPVILTTVTTIFGVLPLAFQDAFWAGLSYTVVFGLFFGSAMTLLVIPSLYYELFLRKK